MDYFSSEEKYTEKNKRKSFLPLVFIITILALIGIFLVIKDDLFPEKYYGPGMTTEAKKESSEDENSSDSSKESNTKHNERIIETISQEENLGLVSETTDYKNISTISTVFVDKKIAKATDSSLGVYKDVDSFAFAGDIYFSKRNINVYDNGNINNVLDQQYIDIIDSHDYFVGNLECCLTDADEATNKEFTFKVSPKYVNILNDMHLDLATIANNHVMDYGEKGFLETLDVLKDNGINYVGGGKDEQEATKPYILVINGRRYAIISATCVVPSVKWFAAEDRAGVNSGYYGNAVCNQIKAIKDKVDKVIVFIHWGVEKDTISNEEQQTMGRKFVDFGADLVVGTHSHRLQEVEYYNDVPIVYGIGNFIFGSTWTDTELLSVSFDYTDSKKGNTKIKLIPGTCGYELTLPLSTEQKRNKFIEENIIPKSPTCRLDEEGYIVKNVELVE